VTETAKRQPDKDELRQTTRELRERLDAIEEAIDKAQLILSEVEHAVGLVLDDGCRYDE